MNVLRETRTLVEQSTLEELLKRQLLSRVDMTVAATEKYILDHKAELELDAANREILDQIERERTVKSEIQNRMAEMVEQFNKLVDEHRYAEAEVVANRLYAMAPDELVAQQINKQAKMIRREAWNQEIIANSEEGVAHTFLDIRRGRRRRAAEADEGHYLRRHLGPDCRPRAGQRSLARAASRNWRSSRSSRRRCCRGTRRRRLRG